jgi:UDP-N-acetylmuramoyl-tripeptide--D-alanyl-D-alanine ligase
MNPGATIQQISAAIGADCAVPSMAEVAGVSTDTRTLRPGDLFIALRGDRFDGHAFVAAAVQAGAAAVVVEQQAAVAISGGVPVLRVADSLLALQRLARWHRDRLGLAVVAITGSNGKTSTKDFTAAALAQRLRVTATRGNLNNHIGLPLSVLAARADDQAAVWELGMNHPGELAPLCQIARPRIGIITNIGTAHIEFLGSRDGIAEEKSAIARALPADGTLVVPAGCEFAGYFRQRTSAKVLPVGNGRGLVRAEGLVFDHGMACFTLVIEGHERVEVRLGVDGRHMVTNALLAAGAASVLGLSAAEIAAGLATARLAGGRLTRSERRGVLILDDSYNANPESMAAAIETLAETAIGNGSQRIAVLGHMAELGAFAGEAHARIGRLAAERGVRVAAVGDQARAISEAAAAAGGRSEYFATREQAAGWLAAAAVAGDVVLFKGSRTAAVEKILHSAFPGEPD